MNIKFIDKGIQYELNIEYIYKLYDSIPIYYSNIKDDCLIIKSYNNNILVIVNNKNSLDDNLKIYIVDNLIRELLSTDNDNIIDIHLLNYFGISKTSNYLKYIGDRNREAFIENNYNINIKVKPLKELLNIEV